MIDEAVAFARARGTGRRARRRLLDLRRRCWPSFWFARHRRRAAGRQRRAGPVAFGVDAAFPAGMLALVLPGLSGPTRAGSA